ncbi:MAG: 50S ribosomal protein L28 [Candidatus Buchananbacteria bacterium RIFCSPLOWO2_01_FULL_46_12]|uniref:Large ribosomal subunit protein bL28 n=2 Tax=Candidatus Buchananiibacteriota TaxID=1817903 RepID=A0A1G1YR80_9BACT|nr:MAG: 50S ribosomal protein L28 [Candidatus Buchananbacteria bacterium RIFCSPHIGHO2_01_FULL_44_11]OGY54855.1 MAG: 50S ribosomal protein L28 [Candidatus Buchananbacteria bacterium RIFCSPLOWO2_01_FULL_46_12]
MRTCDICGRMALKGNSVSHSNIRTIRRQRLNLQSKKVDGKNLMVCTSCLRTLVKVKSKKTKKD